jgi:Lanthionine synthetase C-like protein
MPKIIAGSLALLSAAMRRGAIVRGHDEAIHTICAWLDQWQQGQAQQAWWPEVLDRGQFRAGAQALVGPHRPSWCYGTPGVARAQQLAAIATGTPEAGAARRAGSRRMPHRRNVNSHTSPTPESVTAGPDSSTPPAARLSMPTPMTSPPPPPPWPDGCASTCTTTRGPATTDSWRESPAQRWSKPPVTRQRQKRCQGGMLACS